MTDRREERVDALRAIQRRRAEQALFILSTEELKADRRGEIDWSFSDAPARILLPYNGRHDPPPPWMRLPPDQRCGTWEPDANVVALHALE